MESKRRIEAVEINVTQQQTPRAKCPDCCRNSSFWEGKHTCGTEWPAGRLEGAVGGLEASPDH